MFTSLHIPEEDASAYRTKLQLLGSIASALEMELIADISTASMEKLDLDWKTAETVLDWGLTGLRIDYGIEDDVIVRLSQKMKVALNASTLTEEQLQRLIEAGLRTTHTEVWHNFYPRPETGLALSDFLAKNLLFQTYDLKVQAFIPGDRNLRAVASRAANIGTASYVWNFCCFHRAESIQCGQSSNWRSRRDR